MNPDSHIPDSADLQADDPLARPAASGASGAPRRSRTKQWVAAAAVAGALLGTTGVAMAQSSDSSDTTTTEQAPADVDRSQAAHPGEELLTGDTAAKVSTAAQEAVPDATIDRVETDAEGSAYEAHMTKADGSHVTVKVDESFAVTTVETDQGGPGGRGAPGAAPSTSDTRSDATSSATA